ncbi:MAG TPA: hypothetical protein PLI77_01970 [Bacteroidales bacterium]|nr:hypothetical protein [Bacteroidales bacterium]
MKKLIVTILFILSFSIQAQEMKRDHYSGGMLIYQPGYSFAQNPHQKIEGYSTAIGGILRFYFWDYFTCGIYGGSQTTQYQSSGSDKSFINTGYGGLFGGLTYKSGRFRYTASLFGGIGGVDNLHIEKQNHQTLDEAYIYEYNVLTFSPILSIDFSLTSKISFTLQALCLTTKTPDKVFFYNPTVQVGILFTR